jgi:hypothetical protein
MNWTENGSDAKRETVSRPEEAIDRRNLGLLVRRTAGI